MLKRRCDFTDLPVVYGDSLVGIAYLLADHFFTDLSVVCGDSLQGIAYLPTGQLFY